MLEAEPKLDEAGRASRAAARDRRRRLRWVAPMTASYALDTLFLGLFAAIGTIPGRVPIGYGAAAALVCLGAWAAYAGGWNLKLRDPDMVEPLIGLGTALQIGLVAAAPQITFPFLANLFTVFAFGMIAMSVRASVRVWLFQAVASGLVLVWAADRVGVPAATRVELLLTWSYFGLIVARCLMLSLNANRMRNRLSDSRRKLAASLEQIRELATHDELTRAFNRRALLSRLEQERSRAERAGQPFSIAMIDLDRFKSINDTHGHAAGDAVLRRFAATVHETMRVTDVFGRYGGEEFLMILVGAAPAQALEATERIRAAVADADWSAIAPGVTLTLSAGVATFRKGESIDSLLRRADFALYEAKRGGRNRVVASAG